MEVVGGLEWGVGGGIGGAGEADARGVLGCAGIKQQARYKQGNWKL